jgi:predicted ATPase
VQQYRCFEDLTINLREPAAPGAGWTILVGENGTGKSSLLQAIVLGLLDPRPLTSLNNTPWLMSRQGNTGDRPMEISVDLTLNGREIELKKTVEGRHGSYIEDMGDRLTDTPLMLGFSARRRIARPGELPESDNYEVERVRGLFDPNLPLLAHDAFTTLKDAPTQRAFAAVVRDVIVHQLTDSDQRMFPLVDVLELRGQGGVRTNKQLLEQQRFVLRYGQDYQVRVAVEELSDGYQAMLSIVLEILTQAALASGRVPKPEDLNAIILIDEIEAHLHPRWQRTVVPLLREVFPQCQFICTTHSPLVVGSAQPGEVQVLEVQPEGDVHVQVLEERLAALGADEIYEAVFGVARMAPDDYVAKERAYLESIADSSRPVDPKIKDLIEAAWQDRQTLSGQQ